MSEGEEQYSCRKTKKTGMTTLQQHFITFRTDIYLDMNDEQLYFVLTWFSQPLASNNNIVKAYNDQLSISKCCNNQCAKSTFNNGVQTSGGEV